jgi:UDP-2-acetamido-2,6-beta-L-arabino-hexul-4-ose reductase
MRIMVTGSRGFIGKNLVVRLLEYANYEIIRFDRCDMVTSLPSLLQNVDAVVHLAGVNRPKDPKDFDIGNKELTELICSEIIISGRNMPVILASSIQAEFDNPYGLSKRAAEKAVERLAVENGNPVVIFRLPGVFGKWCKPNYNSVVATFCHNIARDLPIHINNASVNLSLVYIDDVVSAMIAALNEPCACVTKKTVYPEYLISLGELADQIRIFADCRKTLTSERVGSGLLRALYATYVSYLKNENFSCEVPSYTDSRGMFVEMLKTKDCGQFSFFTAVAGITRGGHYHHTKTEKFLVIKGQGLFRFRNILTDELYELRASGEKPVVVETIPGWTHEITNIGNDEMVVMLWASEIFDRNRPDTIICKI